MGVDADWTSAFMDSEGRKIQGIGNEDIEHGRVVRRTSDKSIIGAEKIACLHLLGGSEVESIHLFEPEGTNNGGASPHGRGKWLMGTRIGKEMQDSLPPCRIINPPDLELQNGTVGQVMLGSGYISQQGQNSLGLQVDTSLPLVVEWPIEAAGIKVKKHGGGQRLTGVIKDGRSFARCKAIFFLSILGFNSDGHEIP